MNAVGNTNAGKNADAKKCMTHTLISIRFIPSEKHRYLSVISPISNIGDITDNVGGNIGDKSPISVIISVIFTDIGDKSISVIITDITISVITDIIGDLGRYDQIAPCSPSLIGFALNQ